MQFSLKQYKLFVIFNIITLVPLLPLTLLAFTGVISIYIPFVNMLIYGIPYIYLFYRECLSLSRDITQWLIFKGYIHKK